MMSIEIGSNEAKTKLPELLREVQAGQCFTITLRGKPVANLIPCVNQNHHPKEALADMKNFSKVVGVSPEQICEWIADGRA